MDESSEKGATSMADEAHVPSILAKRVDTESDDNIIASDPDHCRICRGEGTPQEPLFYPCKCSGSIRYVHQDCLMQWLSHSQKKYCELCKTPFRFTKYYDPYMPATVPWPVFIRQASVHVLRFTFKCARWILVLFVWLGWVPWCMRGVWRGLFWVGDGSWITQQQLERQSRALTNKTASLVGQTVFSTQLPALPQSSSTIWGPISQQLNRSSSEPLILWFSRRILNTIIFPYSALANSTVEIRWIEGPPRNPSLLSNVGLLKSPTRWKLLNETIVDILEGQLITVSILVTFILMFLIREWVVQQQPIINLGAALEGEAANPQPQAEQVVIAPEVNVADVNPYEDVVPELDDRNIGDMSQDHYRDAILPDVEGVSSVAVQTTPDEKHKSQAVSFGGLAASDARISAPSPTSSWSDLDSTQADDFPTDNAIEGQDETDNVSAAKTLLTPPDSDPEDLDGDILSVGQTTSAEALSNSKIMTASRPAMPSKEAAAQATAIARTLEEDSLAREVSNSDVFGGHGVSDDLPPQQTSTDHAALAQGTRLQTESPLQAESTTQLPLDIQTSSQLAPSTSDNQSVAAGIADWMWGSIEVRPNDAEDAASDWETEPDLNDDIQLIMAMDDGNLRDGEQGQRDAFEAAAEDNLRPDPEVLQAAAAAGVDPEEVEQVEDGEDMDGVMELIGMQGPLAGLLQNGMFSTVIISMTVLFGIWLPYLLGKVVLIILANPISLLVKMPLRWASTISDLIVDSFIFFSGWAYYGLDRFVRLTAAPFGWVLPAVKVATLDDSISKTAVRLTGSAADRLVRNLALTGGYFSESDVPVFSILAHESLRSIQSRLYNMFSLLSVGCQRMFYDPIPIASLLSQSLSSLHGIWRLTVSSPYKVMSLIRYLNSIQPNANLLKIRLDIPSRTEPLKIANWTSTDRVLTIMLGYGFFATLGFLYLKGRKWLREGRNQNRPADGLLVDILTQAGGVFKVILIITIEMLVFPLYCGFLLDTALLPLFSNATVSTRMAFLSSSPWTSTFIHWFAGTCYMFHFALFVAMCRKILRTGVLYFIRDPDDPSFHPVRDVLERNITTQLRKILFSALVYGALVIICLGAVVWSLATIVKDVFPIHWSSNEPVLEFPADLLVYNFVMPLAVKFFKPSTGLQDMYNWWFRKCARFLRLSHFLFNEQNEDEEGYTVWQKVAADQEIEEVEARKVFKFPVFRDGQISWQTRPHMPSNHRAQQTTERPKEMDSDSRALYKKMFIHDGRLVRAPASDQVRIPKGRKTFVDIDVATKKRKDGLPENPTGLHGRENKMFADIYVPPYFRLRIASFIVLIWLFAATTGVCLTVVPLLFGRFVFSRLIQSHPRMNDVYAFAIGFYLLAGPIWLTVKFQQPISRMMNRLRANNRLLPGLLRRYLPKSLSILVQFLRIAYFYGMFMVLLPSLFGLAWEAYFLIPLHTYFERTDSTIPQHTVHFVSDWTLGVLFIRVAVHVMLKYPQSRPTKALLALVSPQNNGSSWFDPDIRLATRAFILPLMLVSLTALLLPLGLTQLLLSTVLDGLNEGSRTLVFRYSYPIFMAINLAFALLRALQRGINRWRSRVRDEVYLIEERLRNFDDKKARVVK